MKCLKTDNKSTNLFFIALFLYLVIGMHIVTPTPGGSGLYLTPNIIGWFFVSLLISAALWQVTFNKHLKYTSFQVFFLAGVALLSIPLFYGNDFSYFAIPRLVGLIAGLLLLLALTQLKINKRDSTVLLSILLLGICIEAIIGLVQLYVLMPFNIKIMGYTPVLSRAYGSFTQPNVMASFLSSGIALSLFLILPRKGKQNNKSLSYLISLCLFASSLLIVTLQSKTGYLASIFVLLLFTPSFINNQKRFRKPILTIALGIVIGLLTTYTLHGDNRGESFYQDKHRGQIYAVAIDMFIDKPISGHGYGNFERSYREFHLGKMKVDNSLSEPLDDLRHPHNETLFWLVEGGIVVFIALLLLFYAYLSLFKGHPTSKTLPLIALIIPILLHSQTEYPFYHSAVHWVYFIIFIWLTEKKLAPKKKLEITNISLVKLLIIPIPILTSLFTFSALHTSIKMEQFRVSGFQDLKKINSVVNRFVWQEYFEVTLYNYHLKNGYTSKNPEALRQYITWASTFVQHTPRRTLYQNMILAIQTLDSNNFPIDQVMKNQISSEAIRLYPNASKEPKLQAQ